MVLAPSRGCIDEVRALVGEESDTDRHKRSVEVFGGGPGPGLTSLGTKKLTNTNSSNAFVRGDPLLSSQELLTLPPISEFKKSLETVAKVGAKVGWRSGSGSGPGSPGVSSGAGNSRSPSARQMQKFKKMLESTSGS